jgi:hypothetical protein
MRIIETPIFTKRLLEILPEEEYRLFQIKLMQNPEAEILFKGIQGFEKSDRQDQAEEKEVESGYQ